MLLVVVDGNGNQQTIIAQGQQLVDTVTDFSSAIEVTGQTQTISPPNPARSGIYFQNNGQHPMQINDAGNAGAETEPASFVVYPGGTWPPLGYPIPVGAINVSGTAGDAFVEKEW